MGVVFLMGKKVASSLTFIDVYLSYMQASRITLQTLKSAIDIMTFVVLLFFIKLFI